MQTSVSPVLGSGSIRVALEPIADLSAGGRVHALACHCGGPAGSLVESPEALLRLARELRIEVEVDLASLVASLDAAAALAGAPRLFATLHARTAAGPGFARLLIEELARRSIEPSRLTLVLLDPGPTDTDPLLETRAELRAAGVALGLELDLRGYASPHALLHLGPNLLVLDAQLIRRAARQHLEVALLASVARVARSVGARTLARGVTSAPERDQVAAHGFWLAAGPLFSGVPAGAVRPPFLASA